MILFQALMGVLLANSLSSSRHQQPHQNQDLVVNSNAAIRKLRAAQFCHRFDAVIIDVENVRGKTGFAMSHTELLRLLQLWSTSSGEISDDNLTGKLTLAVDHGDEASSYWLGHCAVVFAGPHCKADDTIVTELVPYFCNELTLSRILVVTGDYELIQRCEQKVVAVDGCRLEILAPHALITDLEKVAEATPKTAVESEARVENEGPDEPSGLLTVYALKIGADLLEIEALLRKRAGMNNKRRKKLRLKGSKLWQKLEEVAPELLERIVDVIKNGRHSELLLELSKTEQNALLYKWEAQHKRQCKRNEKTADRIVLAEQLRLELEEKYGDITTAAADHGGDTLPSGKAYVLRNSPRVKEAAETALNNNNVGTLASNVYDGGTLRLVVVSDTHGFEEQLTTAGGILPEGDLLLHLGDFCADRSPNVHEQLQRFDAWLARQPHAIKIVLRGNHDPRHYEFSQSGAIYLTRPEVKEIGDYTFSFVPFMSSGGLRRKKSLPKSCDVLVSHVPPRRFLDRCVTGTYAGSQTLLKGARRMTAGPPTLWLCGHIHEARGVVRGAVFCGNKETAVINCSNANAGIANRIDYPAVVVKLGEEGRRPGNTKSKSKVRLVEMEGQYTFMNLKHDSFFRQRNGEDKNARQMLLAVDLGLRTGVSLFDDTGRLVRCHNFQFESTEELQKGATSLLKDWEVEANNSSNGHDDETSPRLRVTHVAIEGEDPPLLEAWRQAANGEKALLYVKPEEWRTDLLTNDERLSGETSKSASRFLARQIASEHGISDLTDTDELQTDVAESILLGLHVSRRLGWGDIQDPAVHRVS